MGLFKNFCPNQYLESVYDLDIYVLAQKGIRSMIFDVDNTLVPDCKPVTNEAKAFFKKLRASGITPYILSNNKKERVQPLAKALECPSDYWKCKAKKPSTSGYINAMKVMGSDEKTTIFVGDQLFTDVFGANRSGIYSILVKPMDPREEIHIVLKRFFERIVMWFNRNSMPKLQVSESLSKKNPVFKNDGKELNINALKKTKDVYPDFVEINRYMNRYSSNDTTMLELPDLKDKMRKLYGSCEEYLKRKDVLEPYKEGEKTYLKLKDKYCNKGETLTSVVRLMKCLTTMNENLKALEEGNLDFKVRFTDDVKIN